MLRPAVVALLTSLVGTTLAGQAPEPRVDSLFAMQRHNDRAGCAVGVVKAGKQIFAKGYGMADIAQGLAITPHSVFHVASVSKQFAGMSLVLLAQAGKLSLDDDVRKYLPDLPSYGAPLTIRQFLNHTSGIRDQWNLLMTSGWRLGDDLVSEQDVVDIVNRQRGLNFAPNTSWNYSNTGFTLAGLIVKKVTGQTLRQFADSALFKPLGMTQTHFHDDNLHIVPLRTRGHTFRNGEWKETNPNYSNAGATSLFTTVTDLTRWQDQLTNGVVGGRAGIDMLATRGVLANGDTLSYALGIFVGTYRGAPTLSHSGGDPGYSSYLVNFPRTGSGVAVLCNSSGTTNPGRLAEQIADILLADELGPEPPVPAQATAAAVAKHLGLYWSDSTEGTGSIVVESDGAGWRSLGGNVTRLRVSGTEGKLLLGNGPASLTLRPDGTVLMRAGTGETSIYRKVAPWTPTPAARAALVGRYHSEELNVTWEIKAAGDTLTLHRWKFPPARLNPVFEEMYTSSGQLGFVLRPIRGRDGKVAAITAGSGRVVGMRFDRVAK
ncbi:MAG: beta-lactamase family protein [Gemmatimonadales bacterium]|nr:beta-lactamase family protein [Gemmatimonadales bacterium]